MVRIFILPAILISLVSCIDDQDPSGNNGPNLRELSFTEETVSQSNNEFTFDLFRKINDRETYNNFFFSPLSVEYALGMTLNGAGGNTLDSIRSVLHDLMLNEEERNKSLASLTDFLQNVDRTVLVKIANSLWYKQEYSANEEFKKAVQTYYDGKVESVDFNDPSAKNMINKWVSDKTDHHINELIDQIPAGTVMYLINAIYFKATWKYRFDKSKTENEPFYPEDGSTLETDMMFAKSTAVNYVGNDQVQIVDIPYGNGQYAMTVLLPRPGRKVSDITGFLSEQVFNSLLSELNEITIQLRMPRFKYKYNVILNGPLTELGMGIAFSGSADFSRLFHETLPLYITRIIHEAVIEVNEDGSEAAAATAVEIGESLASPGIPAEITIDRPFVFFIREKHSGVILFAGKFMHPD